MNDNVRQYSRPFPAVILAEASGLYAWQELEPSSSGSLTTFEGGRYGTCYSGELGAPAVELNGRYVPAMTVVRLTERCDVRGVTWYDFSYNADLGYPATPFNSGELVISSGSSQVSVSSGYTFGIYPASGTASGYSASGYGFYIGVPLIYALWSGLEVVTNVCPIWESGTPGSIEAIDASGVFYELVAGASGTVPTSDGSGLIAFKPPPDVTSGSVTSGDLGDGAVVSGSVASGQLDWPHFRSGLLSGLVLSGQIGSGQIDWVHARSGLFSGLILSGQIGSGQVGSVHLASGILGVPTLTSGCVQSGHVGNSAVTSGNVASGSLDWPHFRSGFAVSGLVLSGGVGSGQIGINHLASGLVSGLILSGQVGSGQLGLIHHQSGFMISGLILSGSVGSGQLGVTHLQSGLVTSGLYLSGSIGSGQVGRFHLSSGAGVTADAGSSVGVFTSPGYRPMSGGGDGTWASTDTLSTLPSVTLPGPGLYQVTGYGRITITPTGTNTNVLCAFRLYNNTTGLEISGSESIGLLNNTASRIDVNALLTATVQVTSGHTIQMQAQRNNAAAGTLMTVPSDSTGRTVLGYHRLA